VRITTSDLTQNYRFLKISPRVKFIGKAGRAPTPGGFSKFAYTKKE